MKNDWKSLRDEVVKFRDARDWKQFHTPKNLVAGLAIEAAELQEQFLWCTDAECEARIQDKVRRKAIAEELADVTTTAKAPGHWGVLIRRGLKRGLTLFCISQRWAEADKTAFGNASEFVCFMAASFDDVKYLERKTRIPGATLEGLRPLEYVRYEPGKPLESGKIKF